MPLTTEERLGSSHNETSQHEVHDTMIDRLDDPEVRERFTKLVHELAGLGMKQIVAEEFGHRDKPEAHTDQAGYEPTADELLWEQELYNLSAENNILLLLLLDQIYGDHKTEQPKAKTEKPVKDEQETWSKAPSANTRKASKRQSFTFDFNSRVHTAGTSRVTQPQQPQAKPDFAPAPSVGNVAEGPQLPNIPFNDRVRPSDALARPSAGDFATADHANEMYQSALWKSGWRGGETTPQQTKAAGREMAKQGLVFDASPADAEAFKLFNATNAANGKQGTGPVNTERAESAPAPAPTPESAPQPAAAKSEAPAPAAVPVAALPAAPNPESGPTTPAA